MIRIAIVIGSESDRTILRNSGMLNILNEFRVEWELSIISAHRNPGTLYDYCRNVKDKGEVKVFIVAAGMAAALAGAIAAHVKTLPIIGVPLPSVEFPNAMDALLSMVRMPPGCPVAVVGIGESGLKNAAILAAQILSVENKDKNTRAILGKLLLWLNDNYRKAKVRFEISETDEKIDK